MDSPRVLVLLGTQGACLRGTLRGFTRASRERKWTVLHYHPDSDLEWLLRAWSPAAVVIGPEIAPSAIAQIGGAPLVSVIVDRSSEGIPSAGVAEERVGQLALKHLAERGFRYVSTFRYDDAPFSVARERAFVSAARAAGIEVAVGWGSETYSTEERRERPEAMMAWVRGLPKPCGVFTCTDGWGRTVSRYAREASVRVPEDLALVGADNDVLECELISPPLSSVAIPWEEMGERAAALVHALVSKRVVTGKQVLVTPTGVESRRSTDVLAIDDDLVTDALRWIREHASERLTVPLVAHAVGGGRQRLERRFRRVLNRTVQEEIRRAHVESAKLLLASNTIALGEIARQSGFASASLLNSAFRREVGITPGAYRRRLQKQSRTPSDE